MYSSVHYYYEGQESASGTPSVELPELPTRTPHKRKPVVAKRLPREPAIVGNGLADLS